MTGVPDWFKDGQKVRLKPDFRPRDFPGIDGVLSGVDTSIPYHPFGWMRFRIDPTRAERVQPEYVEPVEETPEEEPQRIRFREFF